MPRLTDERGSAVIIVMVTALVFFAMGAVVVDGARLYQERRVLQNGADAAALAVADQCVSGDCGDPATSAGDYADANADDGASNVDELCGTATGLSACTDPPSLPDGADYVRVKTATEETDGSGLLPYAFAKLLGVDGGTVHAQAVVAWGGPSSLTSELPVTISVCEFNAYTNDGTAFTAPPPYSAPYPRPEAVLYLHDTTGANPCPAGPSGSDLPGGFGWLDTTTACTAESDTEGWWDDKTGRPPPSSCTPALMRPLVGTIVHLPVFNATNGLNGTNGEYRMEGYAAFYVTGYSIEGQYKVASEATGRYPCSGQASCISGYFVEDLHPYDGGTVGGPSMGVTVVQLVQ